MASTTYECELRFIDDRNIANLLQQVCLFKTCFEHWGELASTTIFNSVRTQTNILLTDLCE